jgi:hypothetical protein
VNDWITPFLRFIMCILTCYRITELIVLDDGPFDVFKKLRESVGKLAAIYSSARGLGKLINCPFCVGVWISVGVIFLLMFPTVYGDVFLIFMAIAGGQTFLESFGGRWNK